MQTAPHAIKKPDSAPAEPDGTTLNPVSIQIFPALRPAGMEIASAGKVCLRLALLAMGLGMSRKSLAALGWRPLAHGILLWVLLTSVALVLCR